MGRALCATSSVWQVRFVQKLSSKVGRKSDPGRPLGGSSWERLHNFRTMDRALWGWVAFRLPPGSPNTAVPSHSSLSSTHCTLPLPARCSRSRSPSRKRCGPAHCRLDSNTFHCLLFQLGLSHHPCASSCSGPTHQHHRLRAVCEPSAVTCL